jgi:halimadienyl-diphosphate synthase
MNIRQLFCDVLNETGSSKITRSPYDTAWIARLGDLDKSLSDDALAWLCENQLSDGSWGAPAPLYYHDRVICTLAAMTALTRRGRRAQDRRQIAHGLESLETLNRGASRGLVADPAGATIGFEMIMPTLLAEAEKLQIITRQEDGILRQLSRQRQAKLATLPGRMINRYVSVAFSAEMAGEEGLSLLDVDRIQEANGSVAYSPSATAYFATFVRADPSALKFLRSIAVNGAVPYTAPIDVFEYAWILWNLSLTDSVDETSLALCQPHLNALMRLWLPGKGIAAVGGLTLTDGDTTAMTFDVLNRFGRTVDWDGVKNYEQDDHFFCFGYEANPSISTNVHALGALRRAGFDVNHPSVQKVLRFLKKVQTSNSYWFDKWHSSPYYTTSHAIIESAGFANDMAVSAVDWILNTQNEDGSWGFYMPTAEETAYCLQALAIWRRNGGHILADVIKRGSAWLMDHIDDPYPMLWIGKSLYCPELVVESSILSALMLVE